MAKRYVVFKDNCRFKVMTPALLFMIGHLNKIMSDIPSIPDLMITSVNDSGHSINPQSRHYTDEAIDVRTHNFTDTMQKMTFLNQITSRMNTDPEALVANCFWGQIEDLNTPNEHCHLQVTMGKHYE